MIAQMRRYLTTRDSMKIERALYKFLVYRCDFSAHYGLGPRDDGFRHAHRDPMTVIEEFAQNRRHWSECGGGITVQDIEGCHYNGGDVYLYSDGLTCREVAVEVVRLMYEQVDQLARAREDAAFEREMMTLIDLARRQKMTVVPRGFRLTDPTLAEPPNGDARLLGELRRLAAESGCGLVEPSAPLALR